MELILAAAGYGLPTRREGAKKEPVSTGKVKKP